VKTSTLLVVDDEIAMRHNVRDLLASPSLRVLEAEDGSRALTLVEREKVDVVLLDINLPGIDGIETLAKIKERTPDLPVILFTAFGTSERVIEAMKKGAYDYIEKPFEADDLQLAISRALDYGSLLHEVSSLRSRVDDQAAAPRHVDTIIGRAPCMQEVLKKIGMIAASQAPVLIEGGSGTGKELIADAIQRHSTRVNKVYVKVNCGALSESLLQSEIFGHERGAFTGAVNQHLGYFETADGGTILLDEITSMSQRLQVQLLRVLQQGTFCRVGGTRSREVDVRLISLSNCVLEDEVAADRFRSDLYYRINVIRIKLPPLRDRREDIPLLVPYFVKKYASGTEVVIPDETMRKLVNHDWPGNVRQLENIVRRSLAYSTDNILHVDGVFAEASDDSWEHYREELTKGRSLKDILADLEKRIIEETLTAHGGNRSRTAKALSIHRRYLYNKMKQYSIQ